METQRSRSTWVVADSRRRCSRKSGRSASETLASARRRERRGGIAIGRASLDPLFDNATKRGNLQICKSPANKEYEYSKVHSENGAERKKSTAADVRAPRTKAHEEAVVVQER